jgi:hypothetical protein
MIYGNKRTEERYTKTEIFTTHMTTERLESFPLLSFVHKTQSITLIHSLAKLGIQGYMLLTSHAYSCVLHHNFTPTHKQTTTVMNDRSQPYVKYKVTITASMITMSFIEYSHLLPPAKFRHPQFFIFIQVCEVFLGNITSAIGKGTVYFKFWYTI